MGLISAALASAGGVLADQWKEYFYCEALPDNVLAVKGSKRNNSRNNHGSDNVISNGSTIAVADGQCMIIVDQGKVVDLCAEPGEYVYDMSSEPSIFTGDLGTSVKEVFKNKTRHRLILSQTARLSDVSADEVMDELIASVPEPNVAYQ